ncbi:glycerophosphodiester phosphodiesterase [Paenibacillus sp. 1P07SE]|uniref:glycerophosphodiester phosphodiesterase n=1 Tax=Paenibacillus sp. 1P07SE TaxID=3132209 RepID=UPI0039A44059
MGNWCVAHRGASGEAPENTMAAFARAMKYDALQWIELDVQLSQDGIPVVIHDDKLNRTTGSKGFVGDKTAAELQQLDAGRWFGRSFSGERIPLLEEVIQATVGRCRLNVELKTYGGRYPGMEERVVELLYKWNLQHDTVITSFDDAALRRVRSLSSEIGTGLIIDGAPATLLDRLRQLGCSFLSIGYRSITAARMAIFRQAGIQVMAWTVNDPVAMRKLAAIDRTVMICTNYPDRWERAIGQGTGLRRS